MQLDARRATHKRNDAKVNDSRLKVCVCDVRKRVGKVNEERRRAVPVRSRHAGWLVRVQASIMKQWEQSTR